MIQTLSNLMNSPLAWVALLLWVMLFFLAVWQCRKWGKASRNEKIIYKNHPAIPVKEYKLSEVVTNDGSKAIIESRPPETPEKFRGRARGGTEPINKLKANPSIEEQAQQLSSLFNAWDV